MPQAGRRPAHAAVDGASHSRGRRRFPQDPPSDPSRDRAGNRNTQPCGHQHESDPASALGRASRLRRQEAQNAWKEEAASSPAGRCCKVAGPATTLPLPLRRWIGRRGSAPAAARLVGDRPAGQSVRPAVAEMVGWRRDRTASMISEGSMPCREGEVVPRSVWPSWRWMMLTAAPSRASSTAWARRS